MNGNQLHFTGKGVIPFGHHVRPRPHCKYGNWVRRCRLGGAFRKEASESRHRPAFTSNFTTSAGLAIQGARKANQYGHLFAADLNYRSKVDRIKKRAGRSIARSRLIWASYWK